MLKASEIPAFISWLYLHKWFHVLGLRKTPRVAANQAY
jgi:hypothetical protein